RLGAHVDFRGRVFPHQHHGEAGLEAVLRLQLRDGSRDTLAQPCGKRLTVNHLCRHDGVLSSSAKRSSCAVASPSIHINLSRAVSPRRIRTYDLATPNALATIATTAVLAAPSAGGAATFTSSRNCPASSFEALTMASRPPLGVTRTETRRPPSVF